MTKTQITLENNDLADLVVVLAQAATFLDCPDRRANAERMLKVVQDNVRRVRG